ncbi:ABC transporter permease [Halotalea alkalilenta]|uniref:ABC transporter permease n=1 Tax=Halotalea alkalilenta TaxID=376489 RepID=UPI0005B980EF|nr:ABC transporter permease [Halotalea alkalilenta]
MVSAWIDAARRPLPRLIGTRLALSLLMLLVVSMLIFAGIQLLPGDAASAILGQSATPAARQQLELRLGLDQPALSRYLSWLGGMLRGDFGVSFSSGQPIAAALAYRLNNTLFLAGCTALIAVPLALLIGLWSALHRGSVLDRGLNALTRAAVSLPEFFSGYLLILVFAIWLGWLPSSAAVFGEMPLSTRLYFIALPCFTLILAVLGHMANMTRAALLAIQQESYVETARLKGLSPWCVLRCHVLPNAWPPIINVIMLNLAYLIVGVVIVENVFVYPGLGQYMIDGISKRDIPVIQACGLVLAAVYIALNLLADLLSILANPRLRHVD